MSDFHWNTDDADAVVLPYQPRTAVYSSRGGGVIIRQEADFYEEHDTEIHLTPQGAVAVAYRLIEEAHLVGLPTPPLSLMVAEEMGTAGMMRSGPGPQSEDQPGAPLPFVEPGPSLPVTESKSATHQRKATP